MVEEISKPFSVFKGFQLISGGFRRVEEKYTRISIKYLSITESWDFGSDYSGYRELHEKLRNVYSVSDEFQGVPVCFRGLFGPSREL